MVEPSTAALIPALVGIPVLMVGFGGLRSQKYGTVLTQYPRAALVADQKDVLALLEEVERRVQSGVDAWIRKNSGPLPPEKMPWRVAKILKELTR